jgi:hypothetical protein
MKKIKVKGATPKTASPSINTPKNTPTTIPSK